MKRLILLPFFSLLNVLSAQTFDVEALLDNGPLENRINIVVLSDGYQSNELSKFIADATDFRDALFNKSPFREYKAYFNVYAIKVPSNESGADHPGTAIDVTEPAHEIRNVDTYFGSTFDASGIHRLVVARDNFAINTVLARNFPNYDQAFVLVNSSFYGGSGGRIPVSTTHESANEIAIHELGHSFTGLSDEYWVGDSFARETPNMTQETSPQRVKWTNWHGDAGIGIFQHCCGGQSAQWYKPHENCIMQFLDNPFCAVCRQAIVETIHELLPPMEDYAPQDLEVTALDESLPFSLQLIEPSPNTLDITWELNGTPLTTKTATVSIDPAALEIGTNSLQVLVHDDSDFLRIDNHSSLHFQAVSWQITKDAVTNVLTHGGDAQQVKVDVFPNPTAARIQLQIETSKPSAFTMELFDASGKRVRRQKLRDQKRSNVRFEMDLTDLPKGTYLFKLWLDKTSINRKIVVH